MKESEIERRVCDYAETEYGAQVRKLKYVGMKGAPDRMIYFPSGRVMFIEFKQYGKKPRPDQERELLKLRHCGVVAQVVDSVEQGCWVIDQYAVYK